jgi:etoposide-induced 2.4 mRNA
MHGHSEIFEEKSIKFMLHHSFCTAGAYIDGMYSSHHRATLSLATSVDLDVEGGGRLDEDYDGGWSSSTSSWSATGPAAYTSTMNVVQSAKCHLYWAKIGLKDANRWTEAFDVAMRSGDVRNGVLKGLLLSATISTLIFIFELAFFPSHLFPTLSKNESIDRVASVGNVFWLYPLIAGSYFLASSWTMDVAKAAQRIKHGRGLSSLVTTTTLAPDVYRRAIVESYRVLLIANYAAISVTLQNIPLIGRPLSFIFMSFVDAYYCFEAGWVARGWSVERRMRYAESRWAYFVAFGIPSTAISFFHPSGLLNLMLFMLIFPICTVLAMFANPQPRQAPTGSSPLTPSNSGLPPSLARNQALSVILPPRLPIFWPTVKAYRLILRAFPGSINANPASNVTPVSGNGNVWRNARQYANPALFGPAANEINGRGGPYANAYLDVDQNGFGSDIDRGTGYATTARRGATAANIVNGAWGTPSSGDNIAALRRSNANGGIQSTASNGIPSGVHGSTTTGRAGSNLSNLRKKE